MICKTCAIAGDMVAEARKMNLTVALDLGSFGGIDSIELGDAVRSVAHVFHGVCKGSTHCDCQHKVDFEGKALQKK